MQAQVDETNPNRPWVFDEEVTACFDDMLARSIPQYEVMRDVVYRFQRAFMDDDARIVDLGASRGESVARLLDEHGDAFEYTLCEVSEPMIDVLRERFDPLIRRGRARIHTADLRYGFPDHPARVVQSILTLQFVPINYRQRIVQRSYDCLDEGGAFILVEKILGRGAKLDQLMVYNYHALKHTNGYEYDRIDRKAKSLEGVLVPVTADWNEWLLREAGFRHVDCVWRWMNFAAWVAIR